MNEHSSLSRADLIARRAAKARWQAIQQRMDDRAYVEHLALLEPDEPIISQAMRTLINED